MAFALGARTFLLLFCAQTGSWCLTDGSPGRQGTEGQWWLAAPGNGPDVENEFGNTPLIVACQNGLKWVAKALLRARANLNAANFRGNTGVHFAFAYGYVDLDSAPAHRDRMRRRRIQDTIYR